MSKKKKVFLIIAGAWVGLIILGILFGGTETGSNNKAQVTDTASKNNTLKIQSSYYIKPTYEINKKENEIEILVKGKTNLPDGSVIGITLLGDETIAAQNEGKVSNGKFAIPVFITSNNSGYSNYSLWVVFTPLNQPDHIREIFGNLGENLKGEQVINENGINTIFIKIPKLNI